MTGTLANKKETVIQLLREMVNENGGQPIQITEGDRVFGTFFPSAGLRTEPPRDTPESLAELERRLADIDNSVTTEEMIEWVKKDLASSTQEPENAPTDKSTNSGPTSPSSAS